MQRDKIRRYSNTKPEAYGYTPYEKAASDIGCDER